MSDDPLQAAPTGVRLAVRVVPKASRCAVVREPSGVIKVRIDAPPVDGAANARLVRYLAKKVFGVSRRAVRLVAGHTSRSKVLEIDLPMDAARAALERAIGNRRE